MNLNLEECFENKSNCVVVSNKNVIFDRQNFYGVGVVEKWFSYYRLVKLGDRLTYVLVALCPFTIFLRWLPKRGNTFCIKESFWLLVWTCYNWCIMLCSLVCIIFMSLDVLGWSLYLWWCKWVSEFSMNVLNAKEN